MLRRPRRHPPAQRRAVGALPRRAFVTAPALLASFVLAVLPGCGDRGSGQGVERLLSDTFSSDRPLRSGRLDLSLNVRGAGIDGLPSSLRLDVDGPFEGVEGAGTPRFDLKLALATQDGRLRAGLISTGRRGWVVLGQRAYTLRAEQLAQLAPPTGAQRDRPPGISPASLGVDPRRWLRGVRDEGVEQRSGERVVHLRGEVDVPRLLADAERLLGTTAGAALVDAAGRARLAAAVRDARLEIWTGERDHRLRRLLLVVRLAGRDGRDGAIRLDVGLSALDRRQPIAAPADPRPLSELTAALGLLARQRGGDGAPDGGVPMLQAP
ncbi:MAG: hypothetical protein LT070_10250 [Solirubrobacteraceae bacterium]|nr:hypothetical protein [Solirubrobacteraceae bacterium]